MNILFYICVDDMTIFPFVEASAADDFWKPCDKRRSCSKLAISPFATMLLSPLNNIFKFIESFHSFAQMVLKSSPADLVFVGKV